MPPCSGKGGCFLRHRQFWQVWAGRKLVSRDILFLWELEKCCLEVRHMLLSTRPEDKLNFVAWKTALCLQARSSASSRAATIPGLERQPLRAGSLDTASASPGSLQRPTTMHLLDRKCSLFPWRQSQSTAGPSDSRAFRLCLEKSSASQVQECF